MEESIKEKIEFDLNEAKIEAALMEYNVALMKYDTLMWKLGMYYNPIKNKYEFEPKEKKINLINQNYN